MYVANDLYPLSHAQLALGQAAIFAASVTAFVIESYKDLQPQPEDLTAALLFRITTQLPAINDTLFPPSTYPALNPSLAHVDATPSVAVVFYNFCWLFSLILSIGCALGAILVRQWVTLYIQQPRDQIRVHDRVRKRHHLWQNIEKWRFETFVDALPFALHVSLLLFLSGLAGWAWEQNKVMAVMISVVFGAGAVGYIALTMFPLLDPSCPYQTPLSSLARHLFTALSAWFRSIFHVPREASHSFSPNLDLDIIKWIRSRLSSPDELVTLIEAVPSFIDSFPKDPFRPTPDLQKIVLDAIGPDIKSIVVACRPAEGPPPRAQFVNSEVAAVACTRALFSLFLRIDNPAVSWSNYCMEISRRDIYSETIVPIQNIINNFAIRLRSNQTLLLSPALALEAYRFVFTAVNRQIEMSRSPSGRIAEMRRRIMRTKPSLDFELDHYQHPYNSLGGPQGDIPSFIKDVWLLEPQDLDLESTIDSVSDYAPTTFQTIVDIDYLFILLEAVKISWITVTSDSQVKDLCAVLLPIADNARKAFVDPIGHNKWEIDWVLKNLPESFETAENGVMRNKQPDVANTACLVIREVRSQVYAALFFPDGVLREEFRSAIVSKTTDEAEEWKNFAYESHTYIAQTLRCAFTDAHYADIWKACLATGMLEHQSHSVATFRRLMDWAWRALDHDGGPKIFARAVIDLWASIWFREKPLSMGYLRAGLASATFSEPSIRLIIRPILHLLDSYDLSSPKHNFEHDWTSGKLVPDSAPTLSFCATSTRHLRFDGQHPSMSDNDIFEIRSWNGTKRIGSHRWADLLAHIATYCDDASCYRRLLLLLSEKACRDAHSGGTDSEMYFW